MKLRNEAIVELDDVTVDGAVLAGDVLGSPDIVSIVSRHLPAHDRFSLLTTSKNTNLGIAPHLTSRLPSLAYLGSIVGKQVADVMVKDKPYELPVGFWESNNGTVFKLSLGYCFRANFIKLERLYSASDAKSLFKAYGDNYSIRVQKAASREFYTEFCQAFAPKFFEIVKERRPYIETVILLRSEYH